MTRSVTGECNAISRSGDSPITIDRLVGDLTRLGVRPGMTLLVHSSLSSLGWVCGGPVAVILALERVLGRDGTLVMPTHCGDLSDPKNWSNPPVPELWWQTIRNTMPAYDPELTPTREMGSIPEAFRKQGEVVRSSHPQVSFAARGPNAQQITSEHALDFGLGEWSPLSRMYDLAGWVLLLGAGHTSNTSLHLAEYRAGTALKIEVQTGAPLRVDGKRRWLEFRDLEGDTTDFAHIGEDFAARTGLVKNGQVGRANTLLMPQRELVDFASSWIGTHR